MFVDRTRTEKLYNKLQMLQLAKKETVKAALISTIKKIVKVKNLLLTITK